MNAGEYGIVKGYYPSHIECSEYFYSTPPTAAHSNSSLLPTYLPISTYQSNVQSDAGTLRRNRSRSTNASWGKLGGK